jgi:hypothetical protein
MKPNCYYSLKLVILIPSCYYSLQSVVFVQTSFECKPMQKSLFPIGEGPNKKDGSHNFESKLSHQLGMDSQGVTKAQTPTSCICFLYINI